MLKYLAVSLLFVLLTGLFAGCTSDPANTRTDSSVEGTTDTDSNTEASTNTRPTYDTPQAALEASPHLVGLTDQKNSRIIVCDLAVEDWSNDAAVVWEFKDDRARGGAGIKLRDSELFGGKVVLFCGPAGAGIISYETKEVLYFTSNAGINPHSVELLADGTFLVASTTDNKVSVFAATTGRQNPIQTLTYENVHGILWDPEYQVVWMAGRTKLSAFCVSGSGLNTRLLLDDSMVYTTDDWLHDLTPCYGNPDALFVTCETGIQLFDKKLEAFTTSYTGGNYGSRLTGVPAMGHFADDVMVAINVVKGQTVYKDWCMNVVTVLVPVNEHTVRMITRTSPNDAYYKVRVWNSDYQ